MLLRCWIKKRKHEIIGLSKILYQICVIIYHPFVHSDHKPIDLDKCYQFIRQIIYSDLFHNPLFMVQFTQDAMALLTHVVSFDGKKEIGQEGKDIASPRRVSNEESTQRRFFLKEAQKALDPLKPEADAVNEAHKKWQDTLTSIRSSFQTENPKQEGEAPEAYEARIVAFASQDVNVKEAFEPWKKLFTEFHEKHDAQTFELELTSKTVDFLKKYFLEFGEQVGYAPGDDKLVEELNTVFGV